MILAWGASPSKIMTHRIGTINDLLEPHTDKVRRLVNPTTKQICHPLNPKSRSIWMIEKLDVRKEEKK
ncbi:hypothetical protein QI259_10075 [Staphylococcus saprophyticus]|uniref:hypothetical protein n=1 Tax=Staphylococcus epidermidis TaxID=1282 RepID=UPI002932D2EB|nr:hypothetical protein [Staphylococcus saprophyticus]HEC2157441.1 hypothetical protein [Staphylococcus delphini]